MSNQHKKDDVLPEEEEEDSDGGHEEEEEEESSNMIEMTQDNLVLWEEERPIDLRTTLITTSVPLQQQQQHRYSTRSSPKPMSNITYDNKSNEAEIDGIFKWLDDDDEEEETKQQHKNDDTSLPAKTQSRKMKSHHHHERRNNQFSQHPSKTKHTSRYFSKEAPTPRQGNVEPSTVNQQQYPPPKRGPTTSLAARQRRRQRKDEIDSSSSSAEHDGVNKGAAHVSRSRPVVPPPPLSDTSTSSTRTSTFTQPVAANNKDYQHEDDDEDGQDLQALLQQLSTPQSSSRTSSTTDAVAAAFSYGSTIMRRRPNVQNATPGLVRRLDDGSISPPVAATNAGAKPLATKNQANQNNNNNNKRNVIASSQQLSKKYGIPRLHPTTHHQQPSKQRTMVPVMTSKENTVVAAASRSSYNAGTTSSRTTMPPPPPPQPTQTQPTTAPAVASSSLAPQQVQQQKQSNIILPSTTTTTTTIRNDDTHEDEFGDLDFAADDFDELDQMEEQVEKSSSNQTIPNATAAVTSAPKATASKEIEAKEYNNIAKNSASPFQDDDDIDWDAADLDLLEADIAGATQQQEPTTTKSTAAVPNASTTAVQAAPSNKPNNSAVEVDEFGDFPDDIDFDALDQAVAQCNQLNSSSSSAGQATNVNTNTIPLPPRVVNNPQVERTSSSIEYLTFSRYKVAAIHEDKRENYLKTLSLVAWKDDMVKHEEMYSIHHPEKIPPRSVTSDPLSVSTVNLHTEKISGYLHLRGGWYFADIEVGTVIHLCSLSGRFRTDAGALPITMETRVSAEDINDDLVLIVHPDLLITPTLVGEESGCSRRAVLKSRLGSTGLSSRAALIGTMRHDLLGACLKEEQLTQSVLFRIAQRIVKENAEGLLACDMSASQAEKALMDMRPMLQEFIQEYTSLSSLLLADNPRQVLPGHSSQPDVRFVATEVKAIEEPVISPELALKGNMDVILKANTIPVQSSRKAETSIMSLELKTGHNQNAQNAHMAQLALYVLMLQNRHGFISDHERSENVAGDTPAARGGLLLYMNEKGLQTTHVSPSVQELKSLLGVRNTVASNLHKANRPRGVIVQVEDDEESLAQKQKVTLLQAPPTILPSLEPNTHSCTHCYVNRECMVHAAAEMTCGQNTNNERVLNFRESHGELLSTYTGHLTQEDLAYFREWDRLIDLEADASSHSAATAWLQDSRQRETESGSSIAALIFDGIHPGSQDDAAYLLISFSRSPSSGMSRSFSSLGLTEGTHVIISTDATMFENSKPPSNIQRFRHQHHVIRATLDQIESSKLVVRASIEDLERIQGLVERHQRQVSPSGSKLAFRMDLDRMTAGVGTLRQNLTNLFVGDAIKPRKEEPSEYEMILKSRLPRLRDLLIKGHPPRFMEATASMFHTPRDHIPIPGCNVQALVKEYEGFNPDQRAAVEKVVAAQDYTLIQGLPGTGKTTILSFIARLQALRGLRVLITSYTHAAVDNVALKLMEKGLSQSCNTSGLPPLVRVGQKTSCHADVQPLLADNLAASIGDMPPSSKNLQKVISSARIICTTALSVPRSPLLKDEVFDLVIVDEAGQISQPAILGALMAADRFILVGDHQQLPPLVTSELAEDGGYGVSMMKRLADNYPESVAQLTYQYRMHEDICRLSSKAVYDGKMKCGNEKVRLQRLDLPSYPDGLPSPLPGAKYNWLVPVINPVRSVAFVDTDQLRKHPEAKENVSNRGNDSLSEPLEGKVGGRAGGNVVNTTEAVLARCLIEGLVSAGMSPRDIGLICPFRAQLRLLDEDPKIARWKAAGLELSTIDRYQGRDKQVIILSFVRSNTSGKVGRLLQDMRRLNVAFTRAKCKFIMIGSFSTLHKGSEPLRSLLDQLNPNIERWRLKPEALHCYDI